MLQSPGRYMEALCDTVKEFARSLDPKYLNEGEQVLVGFEGPFVSRRVTPRELLSSFIGSMICVEGRCRQMERIYHQIIAAAGQHFEVEYGKTLPILHSLALTACKTDSIETVKPNVLL